MIGARKLLALGLFCAFLMPAAHAEAAECANWKISHPEWIWCDDFETNQLAGYFEAVGPIVRNSGVGLSGSFGITSTFTQGASDGGSIKLAFGLTPGLRQPAGVDTTTKFKEIYYRAYIRSQPGWVNPAKGSNSKMMRATVFSSSNWSQAMISHIWSSENDNSALASDPASCVTGTTVNCVVYNDFAHLVWLGLKTGPFAIFATSNNGNWNCVESHVKLNDPGQTNGLTEFWIDGNLQAATPGLNFVGSYTAYGINAVLFENWINNGSPQTQSRYWDNLVVSTKPIGCNPNGTVAAPLPPPKNLRTEP